MHRSRRWADHPVTPAAGLLSSPFASPRTALPPAPLTVTAPLQPFPRSLFRNLEEVEKLSELGVLFLLFEMGLELSIDRLRVGCLGAAVGSSLGRAACMMPAAPCWAASSGSVCMRVHAGFGQHACLQSRMLLLRSRRQLPSLAAAYQARTSTPLNQPSHVPPPAGAGALCVWHGHAADAHLHGCIHRSGPAARHVLSLPGKAGCSGGLCAGWRCGRLTDEML